VIKNSYWSSCAVPVIVVLFYWIVSFLDRFSRNIQISNFMKIPTVGTEFSHADGRTDITNLIVVFRCFSKAPKKTLLYRVFFIRFNNIKFMVTAGSGQRRMGALNEGVILGNCPTWRTNYFQCIYLFIVLYMFRAYHARNM